MKMFRKKLRLPYEEERTVSSPELFITKDLRQSIVKKNGIIQPFVAILPLKTSTEAGGIIATGINTYSFTSS